MTRTRLFAGLILVLLGSASTAGEQGQVPPPKAGTPLELQFEIRRYQDSRLVDTVSQALWLVADDEGSRLGAGVMVPIHTRVGDQYAVMFKDVGNSLYCEARSVEDSRFRVKCSIGLDAPYSGDEDEDAMGTAVRSFAHEAAPVVHNLHAETVLLLRDGQSAQCAVAADPLTRGSAKVEVTLKVVR